MSFPAEANGSIWLNHEGSHFQPRASRVVLPGHRQVPTEVWIGGGSSEVGEDLLDHHVDAAWIIDCANEFPAGLHAAAGLTIFRVFTDTEEQPSNWARIDRLASTVAACIRGEVMDDDGWDHPAQAPERIYIVCKQGMNRSALMTGRILRGLGLTGDEAVEAIRLARPGALNNITFEALVRSE